MLQWLDFKETVVSKNASGYTGVTANVSSAISSIMIEHLLYFLSFATEAVAILTSISHEFAQFLGFLNVAKQNSC
jgi:hypothetical protein